MQEHCPSENPLYFGARLWYDVPTTASNPKPAAAREHRARAPAHAVSRQKAQHSSLLCARAVPRWLWSAWALYTR